jgi:hypothetical protein
MLALRFIVCFPALNLTAVLTRSGGKQVKCVRGRSDRLWETNEKGQVRLRLFGIGTSSAQE